MKDAVALVQHATLGRAASDFLALTKPRLNLLVVATSGAGYYLGAPGRPELAAMIETIVGTALVAGGSAALNQVYERETDALMSRTRLRPLPAGRVSLLDATVFGLALSGAGLLLLALFANLLAFALAAVTLLVYVGIYTPMKRLSPAATYVGAIPGALPPVIGWVASHGTIGVGGVALFAIVLLWQIPHFMAIAWICRDDYGKAGFPMLPIIEPSGRRAARQALVYALALVPVSVVPTLAGTAGVMYAVLALPLGAALAWFAIRFAATRSDPDARRLFFGSIVYLPLLWVFMIWFKHS